MVSDMVCVGMASLAQPIFVLTIPRPWPAFLELPCHFLFTPSSGMKDRYVDLFMSRPSRRNQTMRRFCWWSFFRVGLSFSFPLLGVVFSSLCLAPRVFASALFWQPEPVHGPNAIFAHFCDKYKREESVKSVPA